MSSFALTFAQAVAEAAELPLDEVLPLVTSPPRPEMGQLAFPCFGLAKQRRQAPPAIATEIAARVAVSPPLLRVEPMGPYVNAFLDAGAVAGEVLPEVLTRGEQYGRVDIGQGGVVCVDFSSPNIAKSFGLHHLRSTVIGHALVGLLDAAGYKPVGINHLGDWGTQFGQLLHIWFEQGDEAVLAERGVAYLHELYSEFNRRKQQDPSLQQRARERFKALESGDPEARRLWKLFRDVSVREFERIYALLGIRFDEVRGESHYEDLMPPVLAELESKQLLQRSQDATVINLEADDLGVALVKKDDGSTLYLTRDLAAAQYRYDTHGCVRSLYVVGAAQALHFKQMIRVLELLGRDWAGGIEHVPFGLLRLANQKMSSRDKTTVLLLEDVLNEVVALARQTIVSGAEQRGRPLPDDIDELAHRIGVGGLVFNDIKNRRMRDVNFDWDTVLSFEGETGPYLQYTAARIASLIEKSGRAPRADIDASLLDGPHELATCLALADLPAALTRAVEQSEPSLLADALLSIAARFSTLYSNREWKVLSDDAALSDARLALAASVRQSLVNGLSWLGIPVPDRM
ncbi:MAG: arginine--tRNA ligase [Planctomycetota bacterium]|nr:MAG: arginine--tRNA ligase [Planctomycetota bacterium]